MRVKPQQVCPCPESRARSFLLLRLPAPFSAREEILSLCLIPQSLLPNFPTPPKPFLSLDSPHLFSFASRCSTQSFSTCTLCPFFPALLSPLLTANQFILALPPSALWSTIPGGWGAAAAEGQGRKGTGWGGQRGTSWGLAGLLLSQGLPSLWGLCQVDSTSSGMGRTK